jgi:hypothetical protein
LVTVKTLSSSDKQQLREIWYKQVTNLMLYRVPVPLTAEDSVTLTAVDSVPLTAEDSDVLK